MREMTQPSRGIHAAILALALLWAVPASAELVTTGSGANEKLAAFAGSESLALLAKPKRKPVRVVAPARVSALSQQGSACTGSWCGRQFVLMIGIGF
jgi:hypothetical protein